MPRTTTTKKNYAEGDQPKLKTFNLNSLNLRHYYLYIIAYSPYFIERRRPSVYQIVAIWNHLSVYDIIWNKAWYLRGTLRSQLYFIRQIGKKLKKQAKQKMLSSSGLLAVPILNLLQIQAGLYLLNPLQACAELKKKKEETWEEKRKLWPGKHDGGGGRQCRRRENAPTLEFHGQPSDGRRRQYSEIRLTDAQIIYNGNH